MHHDGSEKGGACCNYEGMWGNLIWWTKLAVAVLAVPAVGIMVVSASQTSGVVEIAVFMIACWVSTYLGMRLMINSKKRKD
ncbi:MAG: hypothetical protein SFT92_04220 [Rickettsiales bacterium]|nr:hypothetical protein [Rickettsiales bacterium]